MEIKLVHHNFENPLILDSDYVRLLIIENPQLFYELCADLVRQFDGTSGDFVCFCDDKIVNLDKVGEILRDYIDFDFNDKKLVNILYKRIEALSVAESHIKLNKANTSVSELVGEMIADVPFTLTYDDLTMPNLLKCLNVRFEMNYDNLVEKLICYLNVLVELKGIRFMVFVNLKSVLSDDQLELLYHQCALEKLPLLLIESSEIRDLLPNEKAIIITDDLCEIVENDPDLC